MASSDHEDDHDEHDEEDVEHAEEGDMALMIQNSKKGNFSSKPRKGMMAFFHYVHAHKDRAEKAHAHFGEACQALMEEFKLLSEEEREGWRRTAIEANIVYKNELKPYEHTSKKLKTDPNAPKRNKSAFLIYSMENRERIKAENPSSGFGDIAKLISAAFNGLSKEEQQVWHDKASADRGRYLHEMKLYEKENEAARKKTSSEEDPLEAEV